MPISQDNFKGSEQKPLLEISSNPISDLENGTAASSSAEDALSTDSIISRDQDQVDRAFARFQVWAMTVAQVFAAISVLLVLYWAHLMGGLSWETPKEAFNWHPVMMVLCFAIMTISMVSFRLKCMPSRSWAKRVHYMGWLVAALCAAVALVAVFYSRNFSETGFGANMYSLHSWMGALVILLYLGQLVVGAMTFLGYSPAWWTRIIRGAHTSTILSIHYLVGPVIYYGTMATILLGFQEKGKSMECSYSEILDKPDYLPFLHFFDIPWVCRLSHLLCLVIFLMSVFVTIGLHDFQRVSHSSDRRWW